ncbi:IclR family transcriptional regulator C-terminal domain-containing protein [Kineosporia sp. NBRC 101731]|uniref:IclR family transcriptional regulator domain-containing protein n=1 Tax=Kineosporia sp. NBRC 101731 TaxID=3032199 RepID=UPI0024A1A9A5|nr:IclR family transcriptional regulator C-terminal domain-containing protein [Kineosporia sp. NBRC 101731]GLY26669.1 transcriptional regulator [Kineosporia sp. NBRC 101731]
MTDPGPRAESLQSLTRGLAVIRCFDADHAELTLSDVARRSGTSRATARRILHTLEDLGYVRMRDARFTLTPRVLELGGAYLASSPLPVLARPHLSDLTATCDESSSMSELDGDDIVYVARVERRRIMTVAIGIGTRFPAYATSMGRVLLAGRPAAWVDAYLSRVPLVGFTSHTMEDAGQLRSEVDRVRDQGWCLVDEELEPGLRSVAAPVIAPSGEVIAAVNISTTTRRSIEEIRAELLEPLLACAREIGADLARARAHNH